MTLREKRCKNSLNNDMHSQNCNLCSVLASNLLFTNIAGKEVEGWVNILGHSGQRMSQARWQHSVSHFSRQAGWSLELCEWLY